MMYINSMTMIISKVGLPILITTVTTLDSDKVK